MRFYKGYLQEFSSAVSPIDDNVSYYVLDVQGKIIEKVLSNLGMKEKRKSDRNL